MAGDSVKFEVIRKVAETGFKVRNLKSVSKFEGVSPPSVFVGSGLKYPLMNVGILSPLEKEEGAKIYDDEKFWAENDLEIKDVVNLRNGLLNSRFRSRATDSRAGGKFVRIAQEVAIASRPVDVEIELKRKLDVSGRKDGIVTPHGMRAELKRARVTGNVKIHRKVDKVINDEMKSTEGIEYLYGNDFDEYALNKILSVGVLGLKKNKRLVPTRWSITATDDAIGKFLLKKVRDYRWIENHELFYGEFMGNCYLIMLFPDVFSYELFEIYQPGSSWNPSGEAKASTDFEGHDGRKGYVTGGTAGGYYAARLPIIEYMNSMKRQASVLALRIETPSYWASLGVWVVRESVRKALKNKMEFASREELIESVRQIGRIKYDFDPTRMLEKSKTLKRTGSQRRLTEWIGG